MRWNKLGVIGARGSAGAQPWAASHATLPTPIRLSEDVVRVFVTANDERGRGRPGYVDLSAQDPRRILGVSQAPLLEFGPRGCFDDNGIAAVSVVSPRPGLLYMYYVGFELCTQVPYRLFTGLAISEDGGNSFEKLGRTPILDRSDAELYFRCGPFVLFDEGLFRMWYLAGSEWTEVAGKLKPVYDLRYQESADGIHWQPAGKLSMAITGEDEHGFGRPWIVKRGAGDFRMFYSIRRRSLGAYRLGYAESSDGLEWLRKDDQIGLDVEPGSFASEAIMYSSLLAVGDRTYCFYNGDNFGETGFCVAELVPED